MQKIAGGNRNTDIAALLFISEETVKGHIKHMMEKLGAGDRTEAVAIGVRRGIIQLQFLGPPLYPGAPCSPKRTWAEKMGRSPTIALPPREIWVLSLETPRQGDEKALHPGLQFRIGDRTEAVAIGVRRGIIQLQFLGPLLYPGAPCSPKRTWAEKDGAKPTIALPRGRYACFH